MDLTVCWNGRLSRASETPFSPFERLWLFGEGLRLHLLVRGTLPWEWTEHHRDLVSGAHALGFDLQESERSLLGQIVSTLEANRIDAGTVSIVAGPGNRAWETSGSSPCFTGIFAWPEEPLESSHPTNGARLVLSQRRESRHSSRPGNLDVFCDPFLQSEALRIAQAGAFEGLCLNLEGQIAGGLRSSVFWMKDGALHTPSLPSGAVDRAARRVVLNTARRQGLPFYEGFHTIEDFSRADEAFLTSSLWGIVPVAEWERAPLGKKIPGPVTGRILRESFF